MSAASRMVEPEQDGHDRDSSTGDRPRRRSSRAPEERRPAPARGAFRRLDRPDQSTGYPGRRPRRDRRAPAPLRHDERDVVAGFFNGLSAESRRRRFLRPIPRLPEAMLRRLREVDGRRQVAVVADEPDAAEVAEPEPSAGMERPGRRAAGRGGCTARGPGMRCGPPLPTVPVGPGRKGRNSHADAA